MTENALQAPADRKWAVRNWGRFWSRAGASGYQILGRNGCSRFDPGRQSIRLGDSTAQELGNRRKSKSGLLRAIRDGGEVWSTVMGGDGGYCDGEVQGAQVRVIKSPEDENWGYNVGIECQELQRRAVDGGGRVGERRRRGSEEDGAAAKHTQSDAATTRRERLWGRFFLGGRGRSRSAAETDFEEFSEHRRAEESKHGERIRYTILRNWRVWAAPSTSNHWTKRKGYGTWDRVEFSGGWKDAGGGISSAPDGNEFGGVTDFGWVVQGKFGPEYVESGPSNSDVRTFSSWKYELKWRLGTRSKRLELDASAESRENARDLQSKERRGTRRGPRLNPGTGQIARGAEKAVHINRQRFCSTVYCATFSAKVSGTKGKVKCAVDWIWGRGAKVARKFPDVRGSTAKEAKMVGLKCSGVYSKSGRGLARTKTEGVAVKIKGEAVDSKHSQAPCLFSTSTNYRFVAQACK
ncbi:hypothetical protein DFH09DRAFT_1435797 [Mycena vulgaris]|nr:hypothetical protein DFH09DRAFT_1435797 [Mycena vulgaris]